MTLWQPVVTIKPGEEYHATEVYDERGKALAHATRLRRRFKDGAGGGVSTRIDPLIFKQTDLSE